MILTGRSKILDSGSFDNQVWGALIKAWKGHIIAKNKDEYEKMVRYAVIAEAILQYGAIINTMLGGFNLVPAFPLDATCHN